MTTKHRFAGSVAVSLSPSTGPILACQCFSLLRIVTCEVGSPPIWSWSRARRIGVRERDTLVLPAQLQFIPPFSNSSSVPAAIEGDEASALGFRLRRL